MVALLPLNGGSCKPESKRAKMAKHEITAKSDVTAELHGLISVRGLMQRHWRDPFAGATLPQQNGHLFRAYGAAAQES